MKTSKDMQWAAEYVKALRDPVQRMLICEAFVDLFIHSNERFKLMQFLNDAEVSEEDWNKNRVRMPHRKPGEPLQSDVVVSYSIVRKSDTNEWVVVVKHDGKRHEPSCYYTDNKQDAHDTMKAMMNGGPR